jgi:hypothetical protein
MNCATLNNLLEEINGFNMLNEIEQFCEKYRLECVSVFAKSSKNIDTLESVIDREK